jgi:hypothetical protein
MGFNWTWNTPEFLKRFTLINCMAHTTNMQLYLILYMPLKIFNFHWMMCKKLTKTKLGRIRMIWCTRSMTYNILKTCCSLKFLFGISELAFLLDMVYCSSSCSHCKQKSESTLRRPSIFRECTLLTVL